MQPFTNPLLAGFSVEQALIGASTEPARVGSLLPCLRYKHANNPRQEDRQNGDDCCC